MVKRLCQKKRIEAKPSSRMREPSARSIRESRTLAFPKTALSAKAEELLSATVGEPRTLRDKLKDGALWLAPVPYAWLVRAAILIER